MSNETTQVTESVILVEREVLLARTAVRKYLTKIRNNYLNDLRRGERAAHFAATELRRFDEYLDLYERLGGDPADVIDPEDRAAEGAAS